MLDFENNTLNIEDLPKFEEVEKSPVSIRYLKVLRLLYLIFLFVFLGGLTALFFIPKFPIVLFLIIASVVVTIFGILILEVEKGFPKRKFALREKDILFQKGFIIFRETIVPYKRIQHVEVKQGLLFKAFNIVIIKVFTAGSSSGDLSLFGLDPEDADKMKAQILKIADLDED
ncbi:PH domain-containing protein [Brumimicrobium aurantiacum]|uniref:YdbS-like PH domain-containing protein n=1 Tax=Brumimicrobium aurantiacum TaxID=1737063 RepID=A0A3E1EZT4_9FLAO|nr:PH domain-containing protein [Brumimicrobium aurantiacum]RFC55066.1 hypothetical protein DXU93_04395 [Brumimicrobium aurantiacum]